MTRFSSSSAPRSRRKILLVEDEPFVREATCSILRSAGYEVQPAADALEAMQLYPQIAGSLDLVMTDMVLPGRSGRDLCRDLRRVAPGLAILLTSGYGEVEALNEPSEMGSFYLPKPYSRATLVAKIEEIFAGRPLSRAAVQAG
jgi:DNA-binding response OmpR family regulator